MTITYCCYGAYVDVGHSDDCPTLKKETPMTAREEFEVLLDQLESASYSVRESIGLRTDYKEARARVLAAYDAAHPAKAEATPEQYYAEGWKHAACWAKREDLVWELDSTTYERERDAVIAQMRAATAKAKAEAACHWPDCPHGAECVHAKAPPEPKAELLDDTSLRAIIGGIGNEVHNLGCEHHFNRRVSSRLSDIASRLWTLAQQCSAAPQPTPAPTGDEAVADACRELIREYREREKKANENAGDAEEDAYNVGTRDGFHDAVQLFDLATGGDGEFKGSSIPGETVDVPVMIERIVERIAASPEPKSDAAAVPAVVLTAPKRIWLQISDDQDHAAEPFPYGSEITWCRDSVLSCEVEYVRADLSAASPARVGEGMVLVPSEPTERMVTIGRQELGLAMDSCDFAVCARYVYKAMIDAAMSREAQNT